MPERNDPQGRDRDSHATSGKRERPSPVDSDSELWLRTKRRARCLRILPAVCRPRDLNRLNDKSSQRGRRDLPPRRSPHEKRSVEFGGPRRDFAPILRRQTVRRKSRRRWRSRHVFQLLGTSKRRIRRMPTSSRARRTNCGERREPRKAAVPLAFRRCDPDSSGSWATAPRRGGLVERQGSRRILRMGNLSEAR